MNLRKDHYRQGGYARSLNRLLSLSARGERPAGEALGVGGPGARGLSSPQPGAYLRGQEVTHREKEIKKKSPFAESTPNATRAGELARSRSLSESADPRRVANSSTVSPAVPTGP